jgi:hypothetical protein
VHYARDERQYKDQWCCRIREGGRGSLLSENQAEPEHLPSRLIASTSASAIGRSEAELGQCIAPAGVGHPGRTWRCGVRVPQWRLLPGLPEMAASRRCLKRPLCSPQPALPVLKRGTGYAADMAFAKTHTVSSEGHPRVGAQVGKVQDGGRLLAALPPAGPRHPPEATCTETDNSAGIGEGAEGLA